MKFLRPVLIGLIAGVLAIVALRWTEPARSNDSDVKFGVVALDALEHAAPRSTGPGVTYAQLKARRMNLSFDVATRQQAADALSAALGVPVMLYDNRGYRWNALNSERASLSDSDRDKLAQPPTTGPALWISEGPPFVLRAFDQPAGDVITAVTQMIGDDTPDWCLLDGRIVIGDAFTIDGREAFTRVYDVRELLRDEAALTRRLAAVGREELPWAAGVEGALASALVEHLQFVLAHHAAWGEEAGRSGVRYWGGRVIVRQTPAGHDAVVEALADLRREPTTRNLWQ